ncbi:MAG TPA: hypothetical protein PKW75_08445 [candidate division Zixibacteria bacterium]|nr:hypothetical protein [candidate division Zixibacteria bacterium]MDD4917290.1 hypothetical protein [candidate division Zixibacteria bacterium]MDM7971562.1 hypothetical protein [candidate division Zixibacteria bacterium]HOD65444.1 hypothetical protein [candidate division Zixibacteria bacterium]HOZ08301.1 hypothetical protein [candidate division Zixibacteria bacterium]
MTGLSAVALAVAGMAAIAGTEAAPPGAALLPPSLNKLYPPEAPAPVYLIEMHALAAPLSGMMSDLMEGDHANAMANFEAFRAQYAKVAELVPEWRHEFPTGPVETLATALRSGDQGAVMRAGDAVGRACHGCHLQTMVPAQHRFHWGDFGAISVTDPVIGQDMPFAQFMHMLDGDLAGIGNDLKQGQPENARRHAEGLAARYATLEEVCGVCHDTDRKYYVDEKVMQMIADLPAALENGKPENLGALLQGIGQESCQKCHLVHIPAAYARAAH